MARRFGALLRREELLVERSTVAACRLRRVGVSPELAPPQPQSFLAAAGADVVAVVAVLRATSARFLSLVVSADFPRRDKASRRASTSSRLG